MLLESFIATAEQISLYSMENSRELIRTYDSMRRINNHLIDMVYGVRIELETDKTTR